MVTMQDAHTGGCINQSMPELGTRALSQGYQGPAYSILSVWIRYQFGSGISLDVEAGR